MMHWLLLILLLGVFVIWVMRLKYVRPVNRAIHSCGTTLAFTAMYFARGGRSWCENNYYLAEESLKARETAASKIRKVGNLKIIQLFMTPKEKKDYNEFVAKLQRNKKWVERAKIEYEDWEKQRYKKYNKKKHKE